MDTTWVAGVVTALVVLVVTYGLNPLERWKYRHLPGPPVGMFLGNMLESTRVGPHQYLLDCSRKYGPVFTFFMGRKGNIVISDPELVREVGIKSFVNFHDRSMGNNVLADKKKKYEWSAIDSEGMLAARGKFWAGLRAACEPLFHTVSLRSFAPLINDSASRLLERMEADALQESVNINQYLGGMTLEVIGTSGFGVQFNAQQKEENELVTAVRWLFSPPRPRSALRLLLFGVPHLAMIWFGIGMLLGNDLLFKARSHVGYLFGTCKVLIEAAKGSLPNAAKVDPVAEAPLGSSTPQYSDVPEAKLVDFMQLRKQGEEWRAAKARAADTYAGQLPADYSVINKLLNAQHREENRPLTDNEIAAQAYIFILAGYETTSTALAFTMYELARNPDVQEKMLQEIDAFGAGVPGYDDLAKFPYTEAVFQEGMRMYPPVTPTVALQRQAKEAIVVGGHRIPAGSTVYLNVMALHHDPKNFPDPQIFRPERFLPGSQEAEKRHPFAYMPFGVGPRKCIGYKLAMEEGVLALVRLYQHFTFSLDPAKHAPDTPLPLQSGVTISPKGGIWMIAKHRRET